MSFSATCKTHLTVGISCIPTTKRCTFNKRALRRGGAQIYTCRVCMYPDAVRPIHFAIRLYYIARFTPRIESHDPLPPLPLPPPSSIGLRYVQGVSARLPAYLDDSISSYEEGTGRGIEERWWCGPSVVGLYRKDTIPGDLILTPVYEYERMDTRSRGKSKKDLRLIIISRRDAGADISRGNHCGIRSNERRS